MKLNSISVHTVYKHQHQLAFNICSWCIQEQYWSYLKKYDVGKFRKVIVRVDDTVTLFENDNKVEESSADVIAINRYFNISKFFDLSKHAKKQSLLELLHSSMICLAEQFNWEREPLINAYNQCIRNNLNYIFKVKDKGFKSPTKEFTGYVECTWDIDEFTATAIILLADNDSVVKQQILIKCEPHLAEFIYYSNCKWESNTTFSLIAKDNRKWSISLLSVV
jgi:hypothetical protein